MQHGCPPAAVTGDVHPSPSVVPAAKLMPMAGGHVRPARVHAEGCTVTLDMSRNTCRKSTGPDSTACGTCAVHGSTSVGAAQERLDRKPVCSSCPTCHPDCAPCSTTTPVCPCRRPYRGVLVDGLRRGELPQADDCCRRRIIGPGGAAAVALLVAAVAGGGGDVARQACTQVPYMTRHEQPQPACARVRG